MDFCDDKRNKLSHKLQVTWLSPLACAPYQYTESWRREDQEFFFFFFFFFYIWNACESSNFGEKLELESINFRTIITIMFNVLGPWIIQEEGWGQSSNVTIRDEKESGEGGEDSGGDKEEWLMRRETWRNWKSSKKNFFSRKKVVLFVEFLRVGIKMIKEKCLLDLLTGSCPSWSVSLGW